MSEENCATCPSGLEYATEDQLLGVILSHHAILAVRDTEIAKLRAERDAARAEVGELKEDVARLEPFRLYVVERAPRLLTYPKSEMKRGLEMILQKARRALEEEA